MARIHIVTPAGPGARNGNRHTATRWASMLRGAGHRVAVSLAWDGERCDALIALHARKSHASILKFEERADAPLIVVLSGTDLYRDLPASAEAQRSLELADRVIVLQEAALRELAAPVRKKTWVVYQSSDCKLSHTPPRDHFRIAVVDALVQLGDTKARGPLRRALERELDGRVARRLREALRDIGEAGSAERKRLGDDVETLRGELRELKTRLAKLEVKRTTPDPKPAQKTRSGRSGRPKRGRRA